MNTLLSLTAAVLAWAVLAVALLGLGASVMRLFGLRRISADDVLFAPWLGWGAVLVFLQLWHFALPVDAAALALVLAAGLTGAAWRLPALFRGSAPPPARFAVMAAGIAFWTALQTVAQPEHYDTGLYFLNTVRWARACPVVPGLGNLHARLALNNSYFLYVALLDAGPFAGKSHQIANGLLLVLLLLRIGAGWRRLLAARGDWRARDLLEALMLVPALKMVMSTNGCSPSPDAAVFALGVVVGAELMGLLENASGFRFQVSGGEDEGRVPGSGYGAAEGGRSNGALALFGIVFLSAVGVATKLSFVMFGFAASAAALAALLRFRPGAVLNARMLTWLMAASAAVLVPWMARGVILSGYPLFPLTIGAFPVDWRVPEEAARWIAAIVRNYARTQSALTEMGGDPGPWLRPWVARMTREPFEVVTPLMLFAVLCPALALAGRAEARVPANRLPWLFLVAPAAGLVFWLVQAPLPRLAGALFWLLGLGALALTSRRFTPGAAPALAVVLSGLLFAQNVNPVAFVHRWKRDPGRVRSARTVAMVTASGLAVRVPVEGDQCWDAPLPCTPHFNPALRLRVAGDMSKGFAVDGRWERPSWKARDRSREPLWE